MAGSPFRLRFRGSGAPPPPVESTDTIRSTDYQLVDFSSFLSGYPDTTVVAVTTTGTVGLRIAPDYETVQATTRLVKVRELLAYPLAATSGATVGTGVATWTLGIVAGPSLVKTWDVSNAPPTTYTIGQRTPAQYGGYPITKFLGGTDTNWTIFSQSVANAFVIVNGGTAGRFLAWNGTYGSTTRTVGTPSLTPGTYTVTLRNTTDAQSDHTITWTVNADELNAAPNQTSDATGSNQQLAKLGSGARSFGDRVICEDGTYNAALLTSNLSPTAAPSVRSGGPSAPTAPYGSVKGWTPNGYTWDAGWITFTSRTPLMAKWKKQRFTATSQPDQYIRLHLLDLRNSTTATNMWFTGTSGYRWVAIDHCLCSQVNMGGSDANKYLFPVENYLTAPPSGNDSMLVIGQDCQIVGNHFIAIAPDCLKFMLFNASAGSGRCKIAFNFFNNKLFGGATSHGDFIQGLYTTTGTYTALPAGSTVDMPQIYGNIMNRQAGTRGGTDGLLASDGQGIFISDIREDIIHTNIRIVGNFYLGVFTGAVVVKAFDANLRIRYNTLVMPYGETLVTGGTPLPTQLIVLKGSAATAQLQSNVLSGGVSRQAGDTNPTPPSPTDTNPLYGVKAAGTRDPDASFVDPDIWSTATTIQEIIDAYTPKAAGPLTVAGGATELGGCFGDLDRIDHRAWTINPTLLAA